MMMMNFKTVAIASVALASLVGTQMPAFAQTNSDPAADNTHLNKRYHDNSRRPLTVRRHMVAPVVAAAPVAGPGTIVTAPLGAASTLVGLPFQVVGNIFPAGGPRAGGVTAVRYVNAGAKESAIDEGWAQAVPVDKSGPIFVVQDGDPTISPMSFIGAPIAAVGTIAQSPFKIAAAPFGG